MEHSTKLKAEKTNNQCGPNNPKQAQMKNSSKKTDSDNEALEAIAGYINKNECD